MLAQTIDIEIAHELATRLESVFGSCASVFQYSRGRWVNVSQNELRVDLTTSITAALESDGTRSTHPLVSRKSGNLVVAIHVNPEVAEPVVVGLSLPDQPDGVICSLLSAHLEAIQNRKSTESARQQSEFFIDQVTQDFEELTWLRTTNEYFDLCGSKHTIESIARKCFPDLASVIRAESILFVRSSEISKSETETPDWNRVIATRVCQDEWRSCERFLTDAIPHLHRAPRVQNCKQNEECLPHYPGIRNCVAIAVAKGQHIYGWIMAINKIPSSNASPLIRTGDNEPNPTQFGTFEAGLLSAAANIMSSHARNLELFEAQETLLTGVVRAIINAIDAKDPYTCGHSDRVALFAKRIAARLGQSVDDCERIYMAGLLHDVGKIGVPDSILGKPGALTNEEYAIVKKHPEIGYTILKHLKQFDYVLPGVLHHHEAVNGRGYPSGLIGEAIPLQGRILAVADAYDAMTSDRPYRPGMPSEKAESILRSEAGKTWDSEIVAIFLECIANGEIQPHTTEQSVPSICEEFDQNPNSNLMRRIANSINSLVVD